MTRVPITSPLAVLTTRTTQEHLMTTHSPTDLKPGDIAEHPKKGRGIVVALGEDADGSPLTAIGYLDTSGRYRDTYGLTGWERIETIRPGHVQVRVNDLDLSRWEGVFEEGGWNHATRVAVRAANAITAQPSESTPPADEQVAGEKPTSATVTLFCPDCGEPITDTAMVVVNREGDRYLGFCTDADGAHTCPPAQPDEPTEPGIHVSVCDMRLVSLMQNPTGGRLFADVKSGHIYDWGELTERGTVTLGWDDGEQP